MKLSSLLVDIEYELLQGSLDTEVSQVEYDSRKVGENGLFICIPGSKVDGHSFIDQVIDKGAKTIVVCKDVELKEGITYVKVKDARIALALISSAYFGHPSRQLKVIGITGTKGKTTITYLIEAVLSHAGKKVGVIGTNGSLINGVSKHTANTTPESYEIHRLMHEMVEAGCDYCVMEVSSQGLMLNRVAGIEFDYGVFTNLSEDHIGGAEHKDFNDYKACKQMLFKMCKVGIFNHDDQYYQDFIDHSNCKVINFGIHNPSDLQALNIKEYHDGNTFGVSFDTVGRVNTHFACNTPGNFSVYNALVTILICLEEGIPLETIQSVLKVATVKGRFQVVPNDRNMTIIIDYAHNGISFQNLFETLQIYHPHRMIAVYGSVGERTKHRRFEVGEMASRYGVFSVITTYNPGKEDPWQVTHDIAKGVQANNGEYVEKPDRKEAVEYALSIAEENDIVMCLGKGHEDYQLIGITKYPFNEYEIIQNYLKEHPKA